MIQGNFTGKLTKAELGSNKKGAPELRLEFEIVDGENKGARVPYSGNFTEKAVRYTKQHMLSLGWKGKDVATACADMMESPKPTAIEVVIASWTTPEGKVREWSTVRNVGRVTDPLKPLDSSTSRDVNRWLNDADGETDIPF